MDSRLVAMKYTAGLSTPQQVQMALFAMKALMDEQDQYRKDVQYLYETKKNYFLRALIEREECKDANTVLCFFGFAAVRWIFMENSWHERYRRIIILRTSFITCCSDIFYFA